MKNYQFFAKLYGVRGSYPIAPADGTKIGGNTPCLLVRTPDDILIIDGGTGIIQLGKDLVPEILEYAAARHKPLNITLLFTHTHMDHLMGLPFFAPLYLPQANLTFIGPPTMGMNFEQIIRGIVSPQYFPVDLHEFRAGIKFINMDENKVISFYGNGSGAGLSHVLDQPEQKPVWSVSTMKYYFHPKDGTFVYKITWQDKILVFATDIEQYYGCDQRLAVFAKNADFLIHDAQYSEEQYERFKGYGHSVFTLACQAAAQSAVKKLLLYHHDPGSGDEDLYKIEAAAREIFPATELARESWEWKL